ncbi:MAG: hypothetical protein Q4D96_11145 [Propionibacteriaceae bacterium]|nr:hypothetical protein [Propionibacteriaceae bacterium]
MTITIPKLITRSTSAASLAAQLDAMNATERARWSAAAQRSLLSWQQELAPGKLKPGMVRQGFDMVETFSTKDIAAHEKKQRVATRLVILAAALDTTPEQVLSLFQRSTIHYLELDGGLPHVARFMTAHGIPWVQTFIAGLRDRPGMIETASPLIARLLTALDLPIPDDPAYLTGFTRRIPKPGVRWQEHFLIACTVPGAFNHPTSDQEHIEDVRKAAATLRRAEPTDDDALLDGLLQVLERGERPGIQREVLAWIEGLGLDLATERARVLAVLPTVDARLVAAFTSRLIELDLTEDELLQLTTVVLPRREKHLKHEVLTRLSALELPTPELAELIVSLSQSTDTTIARFAQDLLLGWGVTLPPPPKPQGLWREAEHSAPAPFPGLDPLILDPPQLDTLVQEARYSWQNGVMENWLLEEQLLASLVATAHAHGPDVVLRACSQLDPEKALSPLATLVAQVGDGSLGAAQARLTDDDAPLPLGERRRHGVLLRLGELPVVLSTPSTDRWVVTPDDLRARIARHVEAGVPLDPADLAVALGRCERTDDLSGLDAPINGVVAGLAEVLAAWRADETAPARLSVEQWWTWNLDPIRVEGEVPPWHELLGIPQAPGPLTGHLLPRLMARPSAEILGSITRSGPATALEYLLPCMRVAQRFDEPLVVAALATVAIIQPKGRPAVAAALLEAWAEDRLRPGDLIAGWNSELWEVLQPAESNLRVERIEGRVLTLLTALTDLGGLALGWPLLVEIAEELAGAEKISPVAPTVFEAVLKLVPEALAAGERPELPNLLALAARDETLKSITLARAIRDTLYLHGL